METLMTIEEVADLLRVPPSWIYGRTAPKCTPAERLPHLKIGRHLRFERSKVVEWMAAHERNGCDSSVTQPEGNE
jgi:excisionase family DNA binding protein